MKISEVSISRPVFASMMSLALVLFGVLGYQRFVSLGDYVNSSSHLLTLPPGMFIEARLATEMRPASVKSTDVVRRPQGVREP